MTPEQYRHWQTFSLRLAHRGFGLRLRKSRRFVAGCIRDFFNCMNSDYLGCDSPPYDNLLARITGWDQTDSHPTWRDTYAHQTCGPFVCDIISEMMENWNPYYWQGLGDPAYERWDDLWGSRIRCCVRAGIDVASTASAGVLGFTVGDVRRMYRDRVPDWVTGGNDKWFTGTLGGAVHNQRDVCRNAKQHEHLIVTAKAQDGKLDLTF